MSGSLSSASTPRTQLAMGFLDVDSRRLQLKKKYFQRMSQAVSPRVAARYLQIENQIEKILDLQIASNLPIVPTVE
jgi:hypothetical protein